jgi:hypothetical protein
LAHHEAFYLTLLFFCDKSTKNTIKKTDYKKFKIKHPPGFFRVSARIHPDKGRSIRDITSKVKNEPISIFDVFEQFSERVGRATNGENEKSCRIGKKHYCSSYIILNVCISF